MWLDEWPLNFVWVFWMQAHTNRDANLAKRFAVFLGLKRSILDEKNCIFTHCAIHMCSNKLQEKKQYFPRSCSILEVFSSKNSTKYCKKVTLGISSCTKLLVKEGTKKQKKGPHFETYIQQQNKRSSLPCSDIKGGGITPPPPSDGLVYMRTWV